MLAGQGLREILSKIEAAQGAGADKHDPYTIAHLTQAKQRIEKALDADYILNPGRGGGGGGGMILMLGKDAGAEK